MYLLVFVEDPMIINTFLAAVGIEGRKNYSKRAANTT